MKCERCRRRLVDGARVIAVYRLVITSKAKGANVPNPDGYAHLTCPEVTA